MRNETSFYDREELEALGLAAFGANVLISRRSSFYSPHMIHLGSNVRIDDYCVVSGGGGLRLGDHVHVASFCALFAGAGIVMGDFSGLSARVTIFTESDDYSGASLTNPTVPSEYKPGVQRGEVTIGRHVIVGASTTILPGIALAEGAAIGAHSLVTKDCDAWTVYFGVPAKRLHRRKRDLLQLERELLSGLR
jgi:galactoside O-acetyltransferase